MSNKPSGKNYLFILFIIVLAIGYSAYRRSSLSSDSSSLTFKKDKVWVQKLPDFKLPQLDQKIFFSSADVRANQSKAYIFHFWATWCAPCLEELPEMEILAKSLLDKTPLVFVWVAVRDEVPKIKRFLKKNKLGKVANIKILLDPKGQLTEDFGSFKLPESYFVLPSGKVTKKYWGAQNWVSSSFKKELLSLIPGS